MSITRNNHYVPQWYQEGFFEPGRSSLAYVDLTPDRKVLADGRVIVQRGAWDVYLGFPLWIILQEPFYKMLKLLPPLTSVRIKGRKKIRE
jgi:hypothetical protein